MANVIKLRRSAVQGAVPTTAQLDLGELAINTYDGRVYLKKNNGTDSIVEVGNVTVESASSTSGSISPNALVDTYNIFGINGALTISAPTGSVIDGKKLTLRIRDDGTSRALTWDTASGAFRAIGTTLPIATIAGKLSYIGCVYNATDNFWDIIGISNQV